MNRWALMLAESPATLQRLIARRQRITLPRGGGTAAERVARLRDGLCHARTVRSRATLDTGFFPPPPPPPPGSPLVRIWLVDDIDVHCSSVPS